MSVVPRLPLNRITEIEKKNVAIHDDSISKVFRTDFFPSKRYESFRCDKLCRSSINVSIPEALRVIMEFRHTLWEDPNESNLNRNRNLLGKDHRVVVLISELFIMLIDTKEIAFTIGR
jgi:hypothetical protein